MSGVDEGRVIRDQYKGESVSKNSRRGNYHDFLIS